MDLDEARRRIEAAELELKPVGFVVAASFERDGRHIDVCITERLRRSCCKGRVWKSKPFLTAFKNAQYGFDEKRALSPGGSDGIFVISRDHKPTNAMMKKLFDRYIDNSQSGLNEVLEQLGTTVESLIPARLVSHHMRLLGVLYNMESKDRLVLVDYDDTISL
jgi:hypothetical protein